MSRREFSKRVQRDAFMRAAGRCEGILDTGERCPCKLQVGRFQYDHVIPDGLTGDPTLENCQVLCTACHKAKTARDKALIAEAVRRSDNHRGIQNPHRRRMRSRSFEPAPPQHTASRPLRRKSEGRL